MNVYNRSWISVQAVQDKIVEAYRLPPNNPEGTIQKSQCPINLEMQLNANANIKLEWVERWATGIINEGKDGSGDPLGSYKVFLGYVEPCSVKEVEFTH